LVPKFHGVNLSPFVRKVRVALAEKGVEYRLVPVVPLGVSDEFRKISPLGKIPVFEEDDGFTVPDSSVIVAYLERTRPIPPLYPADPREMARALFLEEWADTRLVEACGPVFFERYVAVRLLKRTPNEELIRTCLEQRQPQAFDWLENALSGREFAAGNRFSVADIALASPFVNLRHAGQGLDAARWPVMSRYVQGIWDRPSFKALLQEELGS
jgi:glutathione S-transferase